MLVNAMADDVPILDQVNIVTGDLQRSVDFYRRLGAVFPRPLPNSSGRLFHASCEPGDGHSSKLTPRNWRRSGIRAGQGAPIFRDG